MANLIQSNSSALVGALGLVLPLNSFGNVLLFLFNTFLATATTFLNMSVLLNRSPCGENRFMYMLSTCLSDVCSGVSYYYCGALDMLRATTLPLAPTT